MSDHPNPREGYKVRWVENVDLPPCVLFIGYEADGKRLVYVALMPPESEGMK